MTQEEITKVESVIRRKYTSKKKIANLFFIIGLVLFVLWVLLLAILAFHTTNISSVGVVVWGIIWASDFSWIFGGIFLGYHYILREKRLFILSKYSDKTSFDLAQEKSFRTLFDIKGSGLQATGTGWSEDHEITLRV